MHSGIYRYENINQCLILDGSINHLWNKMNLELIYEVDKQEVVNDICVSSLTYSFGKKYSA